MKKIIVLAAALLLNVPAFAQSVQESPPVTRGHAAYWVTNGVIGDGGSATNSPITSFGVTNNGSSGICVNSALPTSPGWNSLCIGAQTNGAGIVSLQNFGTATPQNLQFVINGTPVTIPTGGGAFALENGPFTANHASCFISSAGVLQDCGVGISAGTQWGIPYYSAAGTETSTAAFTSGQMLVGQNGAAPTPRTLSGDVGSVSSVGAVTLAAVNGIPFLTTYTANGVLIANGAAAFSSIITSNIGNCLLSQGLSSPPIFASCASGSGSAGGSNTQVQFNNSTALGGSPNLTWVSPALTIGVAGSTTGQLALASAGGLSGTVTIQNPSTTSAYNFNLPISAGGTGQPLVSQGGGSTAMIFQTLGIVGGGTNCSVATGTCLDNITGFSTTGFIQRTGAGTYTTSLVIPVSGGGTGLANGTSGGIPYYSAAGTITSTAALATNSPVIGGGIGGAPTTVTAGTNGQAFVGVTSGTPGFVTLSGDVASLTSGGVLTIANSAITNAKLANAGAYTLKGNFTNGPAAPTDTQIGSLTQKASPAAGDYIMIVDNSAASQMKYATVSSIASAGSVSSIDSATGAFTTNNGITTSANVIQLTAARRTLPTVQSLTTGSGATYTTATNALWIEVSACAGGGGGSGAANGATLTAGSAGGTTTFNSVNAVGGTGGSLGASNNMPIGGAGGTGGTGTATKRMPGNPGHNGGSTPSVVNFSSGAGGGSVLWGGGGVGIQPGVTVGNAGATNTGGGGSGAINNGGLNVNAGAGGGSGECFYLLIVSPAASYTYTIGAGGAGGVSTTNGGAGGTGYIQVIEHYGT
jgi:hypothetical protein